MPFGKQGRAGGRDARGQRAHGRGARGRGERAAAADGARAGLRRGAWPAGGPGATAAPAVPLALLMFMQPVSVPGQGVVVSAAFGGTMNVVR